MRSPQSSLWLSLLLVLLPGLAVAQPDSELTGDSIIDQCDSCHGADAEIGASVPSLNGLPRRYLQEQLLNFQAGKRRADDRFTLTMVSQIRQLTDSELEKIARHYAREEKVYSAGTVTGNPQRGAALFEEHCSGCHLSGMGRRFTGSPPITHLSGSYILAQLNAFASGQRGFTAAGKHKQRMVEVAGQLDETKLADITAYIKTIDSSSQ